MSILLVEVSPVLIQDICKTGFEIRHRIVSKGIPPGAKLIGAKFDNFLRYVELQFKVDDGIESSKRIHIELSITAEEANL